MDHILKSNERQDKSRFFVREIFGFSPRSLARALSQCDIDPIPRITS